uniref:Peptidase A1 domain-containing protein n=1 Tax=Kalanchoe fedtschenkoi TaxID=63787 RepID=A0A7N0ZQQ0_KALFE
MTPPPQLLKLIIALFTLFLNSSSASSPNPLTPSTPRPMILPLFLSHPNTSTAPHRNYHRRELQRSDTLNHPNARMRLYDDLLLNGYYTTRLWIGTPPQRFALIVDTGSTVTYVPCSTCRQCGNHQDPKFQPELSSSYEPVKCNVDCKCDNEGAQCVYDRTYAEMSSSSGVLGEDIISFGNESNLVPQRAVFGCENVETGDLFTQHADGIMGLGRGDLSVVDQLVGKHVISDSFSLCYGGMGIGGGAMVLGGISPPSDMVFAHSDPARSLYYNIDLKEMQVAGKTLPINPRVFDRRHGTVLDSGTTYAYLPEAAFTAFKDALMRELISLRQIRGPDPNYHDICFSGASSNVMELSKTFPTVDMVFGNGQKLSLSPENYLFRHSKVRGAYCLGIFQNGKDPTTLLGAIVVRNTLVTYDREHKKIGFWKTNCSDMWETLHMSDVSPPPPLLSSPNSTSEIPPSIAPAESPHPNIPVSGESPIGLIIFDMSIGMKYLDLKPHITELANFIAQELGVNKSQVHLLNVTSDGDSSVMRWAISPVQSAEYISNATVTSIISQLSEHRLQLPDTYGNYKLLEWSVQPLQTRTWLKQHYIALVASVAVVLTLGMSVMGAWFIWKKRQESLNLYKPVDTVVAEQELQPLQ